MDISHVISCIAVLFNLLMISVARPDIDLDMSGNVEICENGNPADVVFLLDASNSIWNPDFKRQLKFVQAVVDYFPIGQGNIQVGIATFSDDVFPQFPLNQYRSKRELKSGISDIYQDQGSYTRTNEAIKYMRNEFFLKDNGARNGVFKIGIVITDGRSYDTSLTIKEAELAKMDGFHMFAIGVGHRVDMEELRAISSHPSHHYTFQVDSYRGLRQIIDLLSIKVCTVTDPPTSTTTTAAPTTTTTTTTTPAPTTTPTTTTTTTTTPAPTTTETMIPQIRFEEEPTMLRDNATTPNPFEALRRAPGLEGVFSSGDVENGGQEVPDDPYNSGNGVAEDLGLGSIGRNFIEIDGCIPNQPMDITFVIDSKKGGTGYTKKIWKFIKNTISNLDLKNGDIKVRFIHDCLKVPGLHLSRHKGDKSGLLSAMESMRATTRSTADLLRLMTAQLTDEPGTDDDFNNAIVQRQKVGVLVTDGESGDLQATLREAQDAKLGHGIELYGVGVTEDVNTVELQALVSCAPEKHLLLVPSHRKLRGLHKSLARKLCTTDGS